MIDLGVGSPDLPPAPHIIEAFDILSTTLLTTVYPLTGTRRLHEALAGW